MGFPLAYAMARAPRAWQASLVMLVILPFWTSFLIRVYAWIGILKNEGLLNGFLRWLGVIDEPLIILNTDIAVYIGIVYSYLPFMVLPLYANLVRMDRALLEAAADLGCRPAGAFWKITVPLARPGIVAGCLLVFIPAVGEFVIPDLLGGLPHADDRAHPLDRVLQQPRLAGGVGGRSDPAAGADRPHRAVPASPAGAAGAGGRRSDAAGH